jgi:hypothetical protein
VESIEEFLAHRREEKSKEREIVTSLVNRRESQEAIEEFLALLGVQMWVDWYVSANTVAWAKQA